MTRSTASDVRRTSRTSSAAGRPAPASMSRVRCSSPPGYWSRSSPRGGALQPPHHAVGVAGDVGQQVADAPAGQPARPAGHAVLQVAEACQQRGLGRARSPRSRRSAHPPPPPSRRRDGGLPVEHVGHDGADELVRLVGHAARPPRRRWPPSAVPRRRAPWRRPPRRPGPPRTRAPPGAGSGASSPPCAARWGTAAR